MRPAIGALILVASLFAGCGGAGAPSAAPTISSTPSGNVAPSEATYSQNAGVSGTAGLVFAGLTCLNPQTVRTESANATIAQSFAADQTFNGRSGLTAVTSSVALQSCADGTEPVVETDYFEQLPPAGSGAAAIVLVGSTVTSYTGPLTPLDTITVTYPSPGLIVDETPFQSGRIWTNAATRAVISGSETLNVNADGSYTDNQVWLNGTFPYESLTTAEKPDESGSQTDVAGANASAPPYTVSRSAPSGDTVIVSRSGTPAIPPDWATPTPCPTPGGTPCPTVTATPYPQYAWYASERPPIESITTTDKGRSVLPQSCKIASGLPTSAELLETVDTSVDIWTGTSTTTSDAYIDPNDGLLCLAASVQEAYYNLGPTSADTLSVAAKTITLTDALQSETNVNPTFAVPAMTRLLTLWR